MAPAEGDTPRSDPIRITRKSPEELKQLAIDIRAGKVFTDRHVPDEASSMMSRVFMPLMFMSEEQIADLMKEPIGLIYEYLDNAGPRSINGYPGFFSMRILHRDDWPEVVRLMDQLKAAEASIV